MGHIPEPPSWGLRTASRRVAAPRMTMVMLGVFTSRSSARVRVAIEPGYLSLPRGLTGDDREEEDEPAKHPEGCADAAGDDPTNGGSAVGRPALGGEPAPLDAQDDRDDAQRHREQEGDAQHDGKDPEDQRRARRAVLLRDLRGRIHVSVPGSG